MEKNVIVLETFSDGKGSISTGIKKWWKITKIEAPECLLKDSDEMLGLIKEAFDAEGFAGRIDCVTRVNFDYLTEPRFIPEVL
jgi:hypothetical protein